MPVSQDDGSEYSLRMKPIYSSVDVTEVELPEMESDQDINTNLLLEVCSSLLKLNGRERL